MRGTSDLWKPEQYERFKAERDRPFLDLLALCRPVPGGRMADLGCGTGGLTRLAHERLGMAESVGIDASDAMLGRAPAMKGLRFVRDDLETAIPLGEFDLVISNAALHWVPDEQVDVITRWTRALRPGGQIAVQVPANQDHPSQTVGWEVAHDPEFASALEGYESDAAPRVMPPERYAELLYELGFAEQHVRQQVYLHVLGSSDEVVEWVKGTFLLQFEERLDPTAFDRFVECYRDRFVATVGARSPYPFTFKRTFFWARLP
jgi:trans-aconitate 2-methyltransferase